MLIVQNHNLKYIMKRLSRYYNVTISIENQDLAKETFTGSLDLKEDVEKVIKNIGKTTDLKYETLNNKQIKITN